jgi:stalled ribosome alternative rescue factor ArfA
MQDKKGNKKVKASKAKKGLTAKSLVLQPAYRAQVARTVKGKGSYSRKHNSKIHF